MEDITHTDKEWYRQERGGPWVECNPGHVPAPSGDPREWPDLYALRADLRAAAAGGRILWHAYTSVYRAWKRLAELRTAENRLFQLFMGDGFRGIRVAAIQKETNLLHEEYRQAAEQAGAANAALPEAIKGQA